MKIKQLLAILLVLFGGAVFTAPAFSLPSGSGKIHPVILIHGINDQAGTWETQAGGPTIYHYMETDGYNMYYVTTFGYHMMQRQDDVSDDTLNDDPSNSFGDVSTAADYLAAEVNFLYEKSGGAKVDIVSHSLGGLVTREYMRKYSNHKIGKFIDIASPHSGSSFTGFYHSLPKELQTGVNAALEFIHDTFGYGFPDPNSTAARQLVPNSSFLQTLNSAASPSDVEYWMLYGDIQLQVKVELFWFEIYSQPILAGDLVVSRENAATIPGLGSFSGSNPPHYHTMGFESPTNIALVANMLLNQIDFSVRVDGPLDGFIPYWHNGLLRNPDLNQKVLAILNDGYALPSITPTAINPTPTLSVSTTPAQNVYSNSSTVMLFDISGSMDERDVTGESKLYAAKEAGARILDIIEAENSAAQGAEVGILSFSYSAWVDSALSTDVGTARSALNGLYANGGTGMPDGLRLAIDQFQNTGQNSKPVIILLSDGVPNIGLGGIDLDDSEVRQQVLDLASEAGNKGICIYTVGFGIPNSIGSVSGEASIDEELLKQVSANSGCGAYYNAQNATQLANVYVNLRHESTGSVIFQKAGSISQGETVELGMVNVTQGVNEMLFTLNWPGSQLDPVLTDPNGKIVDQNYPGAHFFQTNSLASVIIDNPVAGSWKFTALGVEVPEGTIGYNAIASVRINPGNTAGSGGSAAFFIVPLILGGLLVYVVVISNRRERGQRTGVSTTAQLFIIIGNGAGRAVPLRDNLLIGRSRTAHIHIADPAVSRLHARIRFSNGQWFIQDAGGKSGTYVNGMRTTATSLKRGDRIRIGSSEFEFRE